MGRRKKKRRSGWAAAAMVAAVLVLFRLAAEHPVPFAVGGGLVVLASVGFGVWWWRDRAQRRRVQAERDRHIASTDGMSGPEFEQWTARLLSRSGCTDVHVVGRSGDAGADVVARCPLGRRIVVQCKRYNPEISKVRSPDVQRFAGTARALHGAHHALMITTTSYTRPARDVAQATGITLVDRTLLARWAHSGTAPRATGLPSPPTPRRKHLL
ncbi:restriction endonuclease [Actinosynnema sp. NPDC047251]|uniref:Restriction endonuclease type IV Mrr domain-containing protein n=1 Tax=Saccharothrix espanaensis (strain ATCC 51144 / DSM 44229 / JCM 9112 / NBRC 15066 / NRRL 15764) TaxID=1179773 RepID=K0K1B5_SACES|nr:restriction endonuclease [Saccharothrix espanaensis]CCH31362.1 hypothetical protein BN6_40760 [Saccharothrix espanaensis DSM 44229]